MALNDKQQRFANEYLVDLNATQAAIRAGYAERTAYSQGQRLLKHVEVKSYIESAMKQKNKETIAKQDEVLEMLTAILRGEQKASTLRGVGQGAQTIDEMPPSMNERIKAAELLGKRYGIWQENKVIDVTSSVTFVDDILDDETD